MKVLHLHHFLLTVCCCLFITSATAQNYKWIKGGGSIDPMVTSGVDERVTDMCADENRNVYILSPVGDDDITADTFNMSTSFFYGGSGNSAHQFVASYNCNGAMRWAKLLDAYHATTAGFFKAIAYSNGSIYVTLAMRSDSNYLDPMASYKYFGYDTIVHNINQSAFIVRYDTSGKLKWIKFIGQDDIYNWYHAPFPTTMSVDGNGNVHCYMVVDSGIVISPTLTPGQKGSYDLTYDSLGNLLNAVKMQIDSNWRIKKIAINKNTNTAYAVAYYPAEGPSNYLAAFHPDGNQVWSDTSIFYQDVKLDAHNNLYVVGGGNTPFVIGGDTVKGAVTDIIETIATMDTFHHVRKHFDVRFRKGDGIANLAVTPNGQLAATGDMFGTVLYGTDSITAPSSEGDNPLVVIVDTTGRLLKLDQMHSGGFYDWGTAITSNNAGDIYIGGEIESSVSAGTFSYTSHGGNSDYFVAKYGYNCNCTLATEPLSNFTYSGNGTVSFTYTGSSSPDSVHWNFGDGGTSTSLNPTHTFSDTGTHTVCLTVYACDSGTYCVTLHNNLAVSKIAALPQVSIYPNPFSDELFIEHATAGMHISIYSIVGKEMYSGSITQEKQSISTAMLSPGTYILQLTNPEGQKMSMTIVKQ